MAGESALTRRERETEREKKYHGKETEIKSSLSQVWEADCPNVLRPNIENTQIFSLLLLMCLNLTASTVAFI